MIVDSNNITTNPFCKRMVYIIDNVEVGYLEYLLIYERMEIENIIVNEEYRHKGIGTKLMSKLVSVAIENNIENITLEVRKSNEIAINLYKNFGFIEVAIRKNYYGNEDGLLMEKKVM